MQFSNYDQIANDYKAGDRKWRPITEDYAHHMLNVLPPARMSFGAFVCSEPYTHNEEGHAVYFCCRSSKGVNYAVMGTLKEWDSRSLLKLPDAQKSLTQQDVRAHRDTGNCPYCGCDSLYFDTLEEQQADVYQEVCCNECERKWTNIYRFVGIVQELEDEATVYISDIASTLLD
jgi:DNA-directed RNA polymerase subunit M/transcription elongation factor TFIIS